MQPRRSPIGLALLLLSGCEPPRPSFRVPVETAGAQLVLERLPATSSVSLITPSGRRLDEAGLLVAVDERRPLRVVTLTNPHELVEAGEWVVELTPTAPDVTLRPRFSPLVREGELGVIDLRFVLATNCLRDVAAARAVVERHVGRAGIPLWLAGLTVGEVAFDEREVTPCSLPEELRALGEFATARPEAVFVVTNALEAETLGGLAPLGGTLGVPGTELGVGALSLATLEQLDTSPVSVLAHELGHWAGLRHSVERDGREDQLDDTPGCLPWVDLDGNGVTDRDDCGVDVAANLMFWAPIGANPTPSQRAQLQRALTTRVAPR